MCTKQESIEVAEGDEFLVMCDESIRAIDFDAQIFTDNFDEEDFTSYH